MTNGRRQRKKSCSSVESEAAENAKGTMKGSLSRHGKEKPGRTDAHVPVVHGDATSTSKEQIARPGDRVRQWFSGLCWEDRVAAICIEDAAFLATLVDLASSSSGSHDPHTTGASRGESGIQVNWGASFSIEYIEQAYNSNESLRFTDDKPTDSKAATSTDIGSTLPFSSNLKDEAMNFIPSPNIDDDKSDVVDSKGTSEAADDTCNPQLYIESDAFRIQRCVAPKPIHAKQATQAASRSATSEASDPIVQTTEVSPLPNVEEKSDFSEKNVVNEVISSMGQEASDILDHVRVVFPSVYNTFLNHTAFEGDRDQHTGSSCREAMQNPIITLHPDVLRKLTGHETLFKFDMLLIKAGVAEADDMFLSEERYQYWQQSSEAEADSLLIRLLRQLVEKSKNIAEIEPKKRSTLSLAILLVIGMEASIMAAYEGVYGTKTVTSDVTTEGIVQGMGLKAACIQSTVIAEAVERFASTKSSAGMMRIMRPVSDLIPGEILNAQWAANLGLLQLCWLLRSKHVLAYKTSSDNLISWNNALRMSIRALLDDSNAKDCSQIDEKGEVEELAAPGFGSCDNLVVLEGSTTHTSTKKSKKKNKRNNKKKRRVSNADQSIDSTDSYSYVRTTAVDERVGELRSSDKECSSTLVVKPTHAAADELSKSSQETLAEGKQLTCSMPDAEHFIIQKNCEVNSSDSGQVSRKLDGEFEKGKEAVTLARVGVAEISKVESAISCRDSSGQDAALADKPSDSTTDMDDHSAWEIVETKSRGNRNKKVASGQLGSGKFASHHPLNATSGTATGGASATKKGKRMQTSRRRNHNHTPNPNRKMVRDILSSVLDGVDAEVKRRRFLAVKSNADGRKRLSDGSKQISYACRQVQKCNGPSQTQAWQAKPMTMKDVVLGRLRAEADKVVDDSKTIKKPVLSHVKAKPGSADDSGSVKAKAAPIDSFGTVKSETGLLGGSFSVKAKTGSAHGSGIVGVGHSGKQARLPGDKVKTPTSSLCPYSNLAWADQSTAPTVPETLSGISANTQSTAYTDGDNRSETYNRSAEKAVEQKSAVDPILGDEAVFAPTSQQAKMNSKKNETSTVPPLSALLGPGNTNSASSSVASSLEAPHTRHIHHHSSTANENDVGYHLLDVCDRLSRDMDVFMGRRALALGIRRRERGALLAALQDTASKLWTGRCHVEMYGSCATQLDLPSSDLDAVICGLDRNPDGLFTSASLSHKTGEKDSIRRRSHSDMSVDASPYASLHESLSDMDSPYTPVSPYVLAPPLSPNAERVIRLAAELERQPWAVQVKAIPTASVPVVKILADPSRLPGAVAPIVSGDDWMMQQHHMAAHAAGAGVIHPPPKAGYQPPLHQGAYFASSNASALSLGAQSHFVPHSPPPWRGADIMNGLFQVDITFEGPEHGGIGSTAFSARVIQDACDETGLPPDRTPVVQAAMVLKELLAQRRLNEPFSGGLSSYALLLLVVAVLKERGAIRQEMERIERQRLAVAAADSNSPTRDQQTGMSSRETQRHGAPGTKKGKHSVTTSRSRPNGQVQIMEEKSVEPVTPTRSSSAEKVARRKDLPTSKSQERASQPEAASTTTITRQASSGESSWASIAKKNTAADVAGKTTAPSILKTISQPEVIKGCRPPSGAKISTFADAVSKHGKAGENLHSGNKHRSAVVGKTPAPQQPKMDVKPSASPQSPEVLKAVTSGGWSSNSPAKNKADVCAKAIPSVPASTETSSASDSKDTSEASFAVPSLFPQGSNDVLEVLCSGETTAGKLLMHFLLFYGRHFDSHSTVVDVSGKHHPDFLVEKKRGQHVHLSPFVTRTSGGSIDPVTGMLTVDPIIVYDPLEGAEDSNVARSCFAWSSIRWVFAQSYVTLSSAVERSGTPPATSDAESGNRDFSASARVDGRGEEDVDMVSPLLELLLSF